MCTLDIISKLLKEQGKSQKELTDFLGVGKNTYTNWNLGLNHSYKKYIGKISEFLNVSTDYLLGTDKSIDPEDTVKIALFGGDAEHISDEAWDDVKRFAQFVAEKERQKKGFDGK